MFQTSGTVNNLNFLKFYEEDMRKTYTSKPVIYDLSMTMLKEDIKN